MERIPHGDVEAQLETITEHMRGVLDEVYRGTNTYGRTIARARGIPYSQAYSTLHVLAARGFLICHEVWNVDGNRIRKVYQLSSAGQELLRRSKESGVSDRTYKHRAESRVDPDQYADRMRFNPVFRWLRDHGVVDSYQELVHIMSCDTCNELIRTHGFTGDTRCREAADKVNDGTWT